MRQVVLMNVWVSKNVKMIEYAINMSEEFDLGKICMNI